MAEPVPDGPVRESVFTAERAKAFIDAVVAIAMTLLILPLMESVSDVAGEDLTAVHWFAEHQQQLVAFVVSFVIIAMFWINHHRLFSRVERVSIGLIWIAVAWLLSIVWLPVATSMSGQMRDDDPVVKIVYIGSMILTCLVTLAQRAYLRRHRELHDIPDRALLNGLAVDVSMAVLFGLALAITLAFPVLSYYPMFLMFLTGPVQTLFARLFGADRPA